MSREYRSAAKKEAFGMIRETCPDVERAMERATDEIKKQTCALREALIEALELKLAAEDKVSELEDQVSSLEDKVSEHAATIKELEDQVSGLEGQLREVKS